MRNQFTEKILIERSFSCHFPELVSKGLMQLHPWFQKSCIMDNIWIFACFLVQIKNIIGCKFHDMAPTVMVSVGQKAPCHVDMESTTLKNNIQNILIRIFIDARLGHFDQLRHRDDFIQLCHAHQQDAGLEIGKAIFELQDSIAILPHCRNGTVALPRKIRINCCSD